MSVSPLKLTALCEKSLFSLGEAIPVKVKLSNSLTQPVWVNKRMGMGYEDGMERELFFTVYDDATGQVVPAPETERVDVHRMPPMLGDFQQLGPGEAVDAVVDLSFWHRFRSAGTYRIVFTYDNRHDGREFGLHAFTGEVASNPLTITLS